MMLKYIFPLILLSIGISCIHGSALLGAKECTWGPSYWCKNLTAAHSCKAVKHCIGTVWEHQQVPIDKDDICTICKNMVVQARDQLESNETVGELEQVFEGSCKLMYIKPAVEICTKLADEMVPELVDTISSQMNPDVVCSVAGLCNNADIDKELGILKKAKEGEKKTPENKVTEKVDHAVANCNSCGTFFNRTISKISQTDTKHLLSYLLDLCGKTSSYSDSCASIVLSNFDAIEAKIRATVKADEFCHLTGSCVSMRTPVIGDETCDLCQQLILHLKDMLTSDTTALEFKKVLHGICSQTRKFANECTALVDQYYDEIYKFISEDLDGRKICGFLNICPAPGVYINGEMAPMLPENPLPVRPNNKVAVAKDEIKVRVLNTPKTDRPTISYGDPIDSSANKKPSPSFGETLKASPALPEQLLDPLIPLHHDIDVNNKETCIFCQYALHYLQNAITQPSNEEEIKKVVRDMCGKLPQSLSVQCKEFISLYGDAAVALLAQEIDPSQVCPKLKICPAKEVGGQLEVEGMIGKPGCPLCLMAITAIDEELTNNKTEDSIKAALDKVCNKIPQSLSKQCLDLVDEYTEQLVDMIEADFTPEEVCEYLKICKKPTDIEEVPVGPGLEVDIDSKEVPYEVLTNEIPDNEPSVDGTKTLIYAQGADLKADTSSPQCVLCEFIMDKLEELLRENKTQNDIDKAIHTVCRHLPGTIRKDCDEYVAKYAEEILNTLALFVEPSQVCSYLQMCMKNSWKSLEKSTKDCAMCEAVFLMRKSVMKGKDLAVDRANFVARICNEMPQARQYDCKKFIRNYGVLLFNAMTAHPLDESICHSLPVCIGQLSATVHMEKRSQLIGSSKCSRGPGYWCISPQNAKECGAGAVRHCQDKLWNV